MLVYQVCDREPIPEASCGAQRVAHVGPRGRRWAWAQCQPLLVCCKRWTTIGQDINGDIYLNTECLSQTVRKWTWDLIWLFVD